MPAVVQDAAWREPSGDEIRIIRRLLSPTFPNCEAYRSQVPGLRVRTRGGDGLILYLSVDERAPAAESLSDDTLTCGVYADVDGRGVGLYLVARAGFLYMLDTVKFDPSEPLQLRFPSDESIEVNIAPPTQSLP